VDLIVKRKNDRYMKKYLFFLSLAGCMFTACSSGDDLVAEELSQEEKDAAIIAEANMNSDVQIRLGFGSQTNLASATRAPLESDANNLFETPSGKFLGIYCLAQQPQVSTASPGPVAVASINWATGEETSLMYLMERNQPAQVKKLSAGEKIGNVVLTEPASDVQFLLSSTLTNPTPTIKHYYYPYGNWYNYYFYGYYPRQEAAKISETAQKITVDYELDGTQDIIYAKAMPVSADAAKGYNAKYLREKQNLAGANSLEDLPSLALTHKLAQLRFYVQCKSPNYISYNYAEDIGASAPYKKLFQLKELKLTNVPVKWRLTIADRDYPTTATVQGKEGKLEHIGTISSGKVSETDGSLADIPVKTMSITAGVVTATDADALSSRENIPYTGSEVTYWKIANVGGAAQWESSSASAYNAAGSNAIDLTGSSITELPAAQLANVGKIYKIWCDFNNDGNQDLATASPKLIGYAMIPTTEMMDGLTIDNRGTLSKNPFITFTLRAGDTKDDSTDADIAGADWTAASQSISIPTDGFEAGKVYNVILNIPVPEEMHMSATLTGWDVEVDLEAASDQNINMTVD
jgi:hypothetical protein